VFFQQETGIVSGKILLELFAGNGNFTIFLSDLFQKIRAVENDKSGADILMKNLRENSVGHVEVIKMDVAKFLLPPGEGPERGGDKGRLKRPRSFERGLRVGAHKKYSCIFLDPPRAGVGESSDILSELDSEMIVYVSCNPETFAKDAKKIISRGQKWKLDSVSLVDMFPQTKYAEVVGVFLRKDQNKNE
jgi:tRNA/tmRNA/rRNA uracil-C5-methylase (TrmA/RlmC/RlmD family)